MTNKPELICDNKCLVGEGPWWDTDTKRLYWVDSFADKLFVYDSITNVNEEHYIGKHIGCAIPSKDGRVVLTLQDGLYLYDLNEKSLEELCNVEREIKNNRLNDAKCDSYGRLWFGSMSMTANQDDRNFEVTGAFYKFENGFATKEFGDVGISNGIAWSEQETVMYYIDTTTESVSAFDFEVESGCISNRRIVVRIDPEDGIPDGMTVDMEGMIWVAHFGGGQVSRWNPKTGKVLDRIHLPVLNVTACCFGGEGLDELYITTARFGLNRQQIEEFPYSGGLFKVCPGIKGTALHKFNHQYNISLRRLL